MSKKECRISFPISHCLAATKVAGSHGDKAPGQEGTLMEVGVACVPLCLLGPKAAHATYLTLLLTASFQLDLASRGPGREGRGARLCVARQGLWFPNDLCFAGGPSPDPSSSIRLW